MRIVQLDILRTIAIFLVMCVHIGTGGEKNVGLYALLYDLNRCPNDISHSMQYIVRAIIHAGWIGVDLFFVLSGFLVSGILFKEYSKNNHVDLKRFFIRRGFKIYPSFYVLLVLTILIFYISKVKTVSFIQILCESIFITNYGPNIWGHTWSLAVEEHFYFIIGLMILLMSKKGGENPFKLLPKIFFATASIITIIRIITSVIYPGFEYKIHFFPTHLRFDSLFFGSLLAYYQFFEPGKLNFVRKFRFLTMTVSIFLVFPSLLFSQESLYIRTFGFVSLYVGFGGILLASIATPLPKGLWAVKFLQILARVGTYSYSIYLWHVPVLVVGVGMLSKILGRRTNGFFEIFVYVIGSILLGVIMTKLIEQPSMRIRDRFFK